MILGGKQMNELIEQLLKQATVVTEGWSDENGTTRYYSVDQKKFAELIILECAKIADTAEPFKTSDLILKRFDIEVKKQYSV